MSDLPIEDYEDVLKDHRRLVREIDVIMNGDGAAKQANLCDLIGQIKMREWQSVETAPKGEYVLCYYSQNDETFKISTPKIKRYNILILGGRMWCGEYNHEWYCPHGYLCKTPTHWMPIYIPLTTE